MQIELQTRALRDVPIGGVFIADNNELFNAVFPSEFWFEPYVRLPNDELGICATELISVFDDDGYHFSGDKQVAYTGVILPCMEIV